MLRCREGFFVLGLLRWEAVSITLPEAVRPAPWKASVQNGPSRTKPVVLKHSHAPECPGGFVKNPDSWAPLPPCLSQEVMGGAQECAFLTSSQVIPVLLVQDPTLGSTEG